MIVVDEPFRRRRYGATLVDRLDDGAISLEQNRAIVGKPPRQRLTLIVLDDTICASARLRACSSRRSTPNSSSRMGSWLSQSDDRLTLSMARRARDFNLTFPSRDERAISPHERISQKCLRSERAPCDARGEPGKCFLDRRSHAGLSASNAVLAMKAARNSGGQRERILIRRRFAARRFGASQRPLILTESGDQ